MVPSETLEHPKAHVDRYQQSGSSRPLGLNQIYPPKGVDKPTSIEFVPHLGGAVQRLTGRSIIAIHGLDTESAKTWLAWEKESEDEHERGRSVNWLQDKDMLPSKLPEAKVWTYDWNANYHHHAPVNTLLGHGDTLLRLLLEQRREVYSHSCRFYVRVADA